MGVGVWGLGNLALCRAHPWRFIRRHTNIGFLRVFIGYH